MISNSVSNTETVRNVYIIDPNGIVKLILIYPLNVGRFIPEILRSINALQIAEENNGATPANWNPYQPIVNFAPNNMCEQEKRLEELKQNKNGMSWYLSFKKPELEEHCQQTKNEECKLKCNENDDKNNA